ncbi:transposase [Ruminococcus turbiniformis]|nr:transposase [Ruminococcus turbiniformis]
MKGGLWNQKVDSIQKGTKSAKRALRRISGRENRWMSDVNHQISKTLVKQYGEGTLFALEDLTGVSFAEETLSKRNTKGRKDLKTWSFFQLEQHLTYKAHAAGSEVMKFDAAYTSQRCPKCGRIRKENRRHMQHEYACDCYGYRSNDDRVGAMNIQVLGTLYISGDTNPRFGPRKTN